MNKEKKTRMQQPFFFFGLAFHTSDTPQKMWDSQINTVRVSVMVDKDYELHKRKMLSYKS